MDTQETLIVLSHHDFVRVTAFRESPYPGMTEDIVQQVFVEFFAKRDQWNYDDDLRPLLKTMTKYVAARLWREKSRYLSAVRKAIAEEVRISVHNSDFPYEEDMASLHQCLNKLSGRARKLIELRYFSDIPIADIAERLMLKPNSVYRTICRLREKLKACIERLGRGGVRHVTD